MSQRHAQQRLFSQRAGASGTMRLVVMLSLIETTCAHYMSPPLSHPLPEMPPWQRVLEVLQPLTQAGNALPKLPPLQHVREVLLPFAQVGDALTTRLRGTWRTEILHHHAVVFMVGLPAAGKSTVIESRYGRLRGRRALKVIDLDAEMVAHPKYDPDDPDSVYRLQEAYKWADGMVESRFQEALCDRSLSRIIVDGTGTNIERQIRRMNEARAAGWFVKVMYVRVPVRTAIDRARLRKRKVAPEKIMYYQAKIEPALRATAKYADETETVDHSFDMAEHLGHLNAGVVTIMGT